MAETKASISRSLSPGFREEAGMPSPLRTKGKKGKKSAAWYVTHPNKLSTPKEIAGHHGHRPHGPSIRWPALYEHLRAKGKTKQAAAMISNTAWKKKRMGMKTNTPTSARGIAKSIESVREIYGLTDFDVPAVVDDSLLAKAMPDSSDVHTDEPMCPRCKKKHGKGKRCWSAKVMTV